MAPAATTKWTVLQRDGLEYLELLPPELANGATLVYCDPPYIRSTRRSQKDVYLFEWDDHHHSRLLEWAVKTPAMVIISGYPSKQYADVLEGQLKAWQTEDFRAMTRRGPAIERLWWNFPRPNILHDDRFLGDGFRERERIRRRQKRWISRLQRMDEAERTALIDAVRSLNKNGDPKAAV